MLSTALAAGEDDGIHTSESARGANALALHPKSLTKAFSAAERTSTSRDAGYADKAAHVATADVQSTAVGWYW